MIGGPFVPKRLFCPMSQACILQQPYSDFQVAWDSKALSFIDSSLRCCHGYHVVLQECVTLNDFEPVTLVPPHVYQRSAGKHTVLHLHPAGLLLRLLYCEEKEPVSTSKSAELGIPPSDRGQNKNPHHHFPVPSPPVIIKFQTQQNQEQEPHCSCKCELENPAGEEFSICSKNESLLGLNSRASRFITRPIINSFQF